MGILNDLRRKSTGGVDDRSNAESERERVTHERMVRTAEAVDGYVIALAERLGEGATALNRRPVLPRFYQFSDLYIQIVFFRATKSLEEVGDIGKLAEDLRLDLLGMDVTTSELVQIRVGTLRWIDLTSLHRTITEAEKRVTFDADQKALNSATTLARIVEQRVEDTGRIICGKPVLILPDKRLLQTDGSALGASPVANRMFASAAVAPPACQLDARHEGECSPVPDHL